MASKKIQFKLTAVDKTKAAFDKVSKSLKTVGGGAMKAAKLIGGIGLAAIGAAAGLAILVKKSFEYIDTLGKTARRTGIATETLQAFQLAAIESGSTVEQTQKGLEKFARSIGDAGRGLKTQADIFKDLNVDLKNTDGTLRSFEEILNDTADGIVQLGSESERATVLANLFGRAGMQFSEVFRGGAEGIRDFTKRANELGIILSDKTIKNVEQFNDSMSVVKLQLGAVKNQVFAAFVPALQAISEKLSTTLKDANAAAGGFNQLGIEMAVGVMEGFKTFVSATAGFLDRIALMGNGIAGTFAVINKGLAHLNKLILSIQVNLFGFKELEKDLVDAKIAILEANKAIENLAAERENLGKLSETAEGFTSTMDELIQSIKDGGVDFEKFLQNNQAGLTNNLSALERFKDGITGKDGLTNALDNVAIGSMKKFEDTIVDGLKTGKFAFKDFASFVVEQLIRVAIQQLIVARLVDPFRGLFGFSSSSTSTSTSSSGGGGGGLFVGDGGGFTGRGARALGVDGKGGFPAILHPNETVIDHTKGQGMGATVNFNITTVDASSFDELLASRKGLITSIINNAMNNQGKMGVV
jgi:hypothetical protein|tara:strand:- start:680 stop:2434 length:1755 start_codon:yes stop_codon:yes gene_type:complete